MRALRIVKTGFGQPSIFNTDAIVQELVRQGKSVEDARNGGASGCVEAGAFGKESLHPDGLFQPAQGLRDHAPQRRRSEDREEDRPRDGRPDGRSGPSTSSSRPSAGRSAISSTIKVRGSNVIEKLYAEYLPAPFLSVLIDDCVKKGKDYHAGGARYNTNYIQGVGLGTITDILSAIRYNVYRPRRTSRWPSSSRPSDKNFVGYESLRQRVLNKTPKFGNDDDYADGLMRRVFDAYFEAVDGRPTPRGGKYRINLLPTTAHIYFGKMTGRHGRRPPGGRRRLRGRLARPGRRPQGADGGRQVARQDGPRPDGRHAPQPEVHAPAPGRRHGPARRQGPRPVLLPLMGHHIQFNVVDGRHAAGGPGPPGAVPRPHRPRRRLQRLLRRLLDRAPERDHQADGTPASISKEGLSRSGGGPLFAFIS